MSTTTGTGTGTKKTVTEEFSIHAKDIKASLSQLRKELTREIEGILKPIVEEAKIRRVVIKNKGGREFVNLPITAGSAIAVTTLLVAPVITTLAAIGALAADLTLVVEKEVEEKPAEGPAKS